MSLYARSLSHHECNRDHATRSEGASELVRLATGLELGDVAALAMRYEAEVNMCAIAEARVAWGSLWYLG